MCVTLGHAVLNTFVNTGVTSEEDPNTKTAEFIKFWVPELKNFTAQYIYEPHLAPDSVQTSCNCLIGVDYPSPIVDRKTSAKENLAKFKASLGKKVSI